MHEVVHRMGYLILGAAGNTGNPTPHHPWGECLRCIVVGAENDATKKIANFSSGCCNELVDVILRGTNFAMDSIDVKFHGTSFATATLAGAFSYIIPHIWDVDNWKTIRSVTKKFLDQSTDKVSCEFHVGMHGKRFNFKKAMNNLVLYGDYILHYLTFFNFIITLF